MYPTTKSAFDKSVWVQWIVNMKKKTFYGVYFNISIEEPLGHFRGQEYVHQWRRWIEFSRNTQSWLSTKSVSNQICICHDTWFKIKVIDFSISLSFKFKQYKNVNVVNFVSYGKTRMWIYPAWTPVDLRSNSPKSSVQGVQSLGQLAAF